MLYLIRVAIVGVCNIASMLVQSVMYFRSRGSLDGIMTSNIGGYGVGDIESISLVEKLGRIYMKPYLSIPTLSRRSMMQNGSA